MRTLTAAVVTGLLMLLAACGGPSEDDEAAKAISDSIMSEQQQGGGGVDEIFRMEREEADCIGEGFVETIGVDQLKEYGLLSEDLEAEAMTDVAMEPADAEAATDTLFECADVSELMSQAMAAGQEVDEETRRCLAEVLTEDRLRSMFTLMFSGKAEQAGQEVIGPMMECATGSPQ